MSDVSAYAGTRRRPSLTSRTALGLIGLYQRHLSPRKGFSCAHRVLHGGTGCSGYAKSAIAEHGAVAALPLIRARFAACKSAHRQILAKEAVREDDESQDEDQSLAAARKRRKRRERGCVPAFGCCGGTTTHHRRQQNCDCCDPTDAASCDAGACDCSPG